MIYAHIHADSVLACPIYWAWTAESGLVSRPLIDLLESMNETFIYDLWTLDDNIMYITSMFSCLLFQSDVFFFYWYTLNSLVLISYVCVHNIMDAIYIQHIHFTCNIHIIYTRFFLGQSSIALNPGVGCMRMVQPLALEFVPVL